MSNTIDIENFLGKDAAPQQARVSYTINNHQPVISTIIGSDPLFYMDYSEDMLDEDEEFVFDSAELGILDDELSSLSKEIQKLDTLSADYAQSSEQSAAIFYETRNSLTGQEPSDIITTTTAQIRDALTQSRIAKAYLDQADQFGAEIIITGQVQDAIYDRKSGNILINSNLSFTDQILLTARELRRHFQHRRGALLNPLNFHPDSAIVMNRAQQADLITSVIRVAWELQLSGNKDVWERVENSSFADLGRAFVREAHLDFRTINNGQAATAVFEAWFLSERCRTEDKKLIQQMLADNEGYVFDIENAHNAVTPAVLAALGEMPFGKNYLAIHTETILTDPIFTEVRDRSNANFLWFIKFERTFRETERDLQTDFSSAADGSVSASHEGSDNEENIIQLHNGSNQPDQSSRDDGRLLADQSGSDNPQETDNVVYLRRIPGEA